MSTDPAGKTTTLATIIGAVLVELRVRADLRQRDLAVAAGIVPSSWSRIERGEGDLLAEQLVVITRALRMPSNFVLDVAEDVARRVERRGDTVVWLRRGLPAGAIASDQFLGVADLAELVQKVLATDRFDLTVHHRVSSKLLHQVPENFVMACGDCAETITHAPVIGRRVDPKALKAKRR